MQLGVTVESLWSVFDVERKSFLFYAMMHLPGSKTATEMPITKAIYEELLSTAMGEGSADSPSEPSDSEENPPPGALTRGEDNTFTFTALPTEPPSFEARAQPPITVEQDSAGNPYMSQDGVDMSELTGSKGQDTDNSGAGSL